MGKHTAHGYLVEDVYKEAEKFKKLFGFKPARIDETFAGFPMEGKVEFFLWQWKHLEDNLGKEVMAKVKYRDQQAIRCDTPEEVDEAYEQLKAEGMEFISEPKVECPLCIFFGCVRTYVGNILLDRCSAVRRSGPCQGKEWIIEMKTK